MRTRLIDRRFVKRASKMTPEVQAVVRGPLAAAPELRSERLVEVVRDTLQVEVPASTMRQWLQQQGLSHRSGPPPTEGPKPAVGAVALPNAGAELLKALDEQIGATEALTASLGDGGPGGVADADRPGARRRQVEGQRC